MENGSDINQQPGETIKIVSRFNKMLKRIFIGFLLLLLLSVTGGITIGTFYGDEVKAYVIEQVNKQLNTQVVIDPADIQFSVLKNFPSASIEFKHVLALDAIPGKGKKDTLFSAGLVSMQFSIMDIFHKNYKVKKLSVLNAFLYIKIYKNGTDNYHFLKTSADTSVGGNFSFALEKINLKNVRIQYSNQKNKQLHLLVVNEGQLSGHFSNEEYDLKTKLDLYVNKLSADSITYLKEKPAELKVNLSVNKTTNTYNIQEGKIKLADIALDLTGNVIYLDSITKTDLQVKGDKMSIVSILSLLPNKYKEKINDYSSEGDFQFEAKIKGNYSSTETPQVSARFTVEHGEVKQNRSGLAFNNIQLRGAYSNAGSSILRVDEISGKLSQGKLNGHFSIENFSHPFLRLSMNADIDLNNFQKFMQIDTIESLEGRAVVGLSFKGRIPTSTDSKTLVGKDLKEASTSGNLELSGVKMQLKNNKLNFDSISGSFVFDNSDILVNDFKGRISESDFTLKGVLKNILPYAFLENEDLTVEAKLKCEKLNLNEFLVDDEKTTRRDTVYELTFSDRLHLDLNSTMGELKFRHFTANNVKGHITLENKKMIIDPVSFDAVGGKITGSSLIDATRGNRITIACSANLDQVNITQLFTELGNFGQTTFTDKNIKGFITSEIHYTSEWSSRLKPNLDKVVATADIKIERGEILNFEPMKSFSKFLNVKDLEDIKFATLENQIEIKNQTIFIPKMDLKNNALNISCSGSHKFNNEIDYHIRLLMRELLAKKAGAAKKENEEFGEVEDDGLSRTLFVSMTGTVSNPIIKYDRKGMFKKIKEDIKKEKNNLKTILHEEFGWFKKDSTIAKDSKKDEKKKDGKMNFKWDENGKNDKTDKKEDEDF